MTETESFQKHFGEQWAGITQSDAYVSAGTVTLNKELDALRTLSDEEIAKNGVVILARFCGVLRHESALFSLPTEREFKFGAAPAEDYPDPEKEFIEQAEKEAQAHPQQSEPPPPITRKPRRKKPTRK